MGRRERFFLLSPPFVSAGVVFSVVVGYRTCLHGAVGSKGVARAWFPSPPLGKGSGERGGGAAGEWRARDREAVPCFDRLLVAWWNEESGIDLG